MTVKDQQRPMFVTVTGVQRLSEQMARITLAGDEVPNFAYAGPDHLARVFFPVAADFRLPVTEEWWPELQAMPIDRRPVMRNYTVRRIDHARGELDIDFVLHGDTGPASKWACAAAPGDRIGVLSDRSEYEPNNADWQLLVGDETALPAIAGILESLKPRTKAFAYLEVAEYFTLLELTVPEGVELTWLTRGTKRGIEVIKALDEVEFPDGKPYAWVAGASKLATSIRRYLVNERDVAKKDIYFCGYWSANRPAYD